MRRYNAASCLVVASALCLAGLALPATGCIWIAVGAGGGAVAGAAAADKDRDAGDVVTDAALVARVKTALAADREVSALRVKVHAHLGVITLRGYVRSKREMRRAVKVAHRVRGVKKVQAEMVIDPDLEVEDDG